MKLFAALPAILGAALQVAGQASNDAKVISELKDVPSRLDRINTISTDSDFTFNFGGDIGVTRAAGGNMTVATVSDFPALLGNGQAAAVIDLGPCGMNAPHTHPRATEFLYVINGTIEVAFIEENGARLVKNNVTVGQGTVIPLGAVHYQLNTGCEPVRLVTFFNDEDPGQIQFAQRFFGLPSDAVDAVLGDIGTKGIVTIINSIPDNLALGTDSCLAKCNLTRGTQTKTEQQPRGKYNPLPSI